MIFGRSIIKFYYSKIAISDECIACSSISEANCAQNPGILKPQRCNSNGPSTCYTRVVSEYRPFYSKPFLYSLNVFNSSLFTDNNPNVG